MMSTNLYLAHYGVKGMKWGIRRYQRKDGSLTRAGKKHYSKMNPEQLRDDLDSQIRDIRAKRYGKNYLLPLGENTKKIFDLNRKQSEEYYNSEEYRNWRKKANASNADPPPVDPSIFSGMDQAYLMTYKDKNTMSTYEYQLGKSYLKNGGLEYSSALIKDMGYSDDVAKDFVKRLSKKNLVLDLKP